MCLPHASRQGLGWSPLVPVVLLLGDLRGVGCVTARLCNSPVPQMGPGALGAAGGAACRPRPAQVSAHRGPALGQRSLGRA